MKKVFQTKIYEFEKVKGDGFEKIDYDSDSTNSEVNALIEQAINLIAQWLECWCANLATQVQLGDLA